MVNLLWDDVRDMFDPGANGVLPDVYVRDTTVADWQAVLDLIRSKGWAYQYEDNGHEVRMPNRADEILARHPEAMPIVRVWPYPDLLAIFRPWAADLINFDVDLRELQGQVQLDKLCSFLRVIGRQLGKPVLMHPEGQGTKPDIGYLPDVDRVVNLVAPENRHPPSS